MLQQGEMREPDAGWLALARHELAALIERKCPADGLHATAIDGLMLYRCTDPQAPMCGMYRPALALAAAGAKRVVLADEAYEYDHSRYLLTAVDLPVVSQVTRVPYLCFVLELNPARIAELIGQLPPQPPRAVGRGMGVGEIERSLLDPVLRLVRLLDQPADIPLLAPLYERELLYRLLCGPQGARLHALAMGEGASHQLSRAVKWLQQHFTTPFSMEELARHAGMSVSSLHHGFKALTALSPLQYQKQLRLQEARRLMLAENHDAASAAHRVGYESPSQFSREYSRQYGAPPMRDIQQLRGQVVG